MMLVPAPARADESWRANVTALPPGKFPELPDVAMHFTFGWSNVLTAAQADIAIRRKGPVSHAVVSGRTSGLARSLWPLDAQHSSTFQTALLRPIRIAQFERYRKSTIETEVRYDSAGLDRLRKVTPTKTPPKWKRVNFEPIHDVISGILYVRSQPLKIGDKIGLVCFPGDSPYLAVVTVQAKEDIECMGKMRPALKLALEVRKLEVKNKKPTQAVAYEKFKSGAFWVSDDALRLPLRAEVSVFVGFVHGELTGYRML